jgi:hypothetical protein
MLKMLGKKLIFVTILALAITAQAATNDFTADGNIIVTGVAADNNDLTDLVIMNSSTAESWEFSGSNLNVSSPGTFRVGSHDQSVGALEASSGGTTVCAANNTPGTSYVELTTSNTGTYRIVPLKTAGCSGSSGGGNSGGGGGSKKPKEPVVPVTPPPVTPATPSVLPQVPANPLPAFPAWLNASPNEAFNRRLVVGSIGSDVKSLQQFLNSNGFAVATAGAGSPGNETTTFGPATNRALIKFQMAQGIIQMATDAGAGQVGPMTRAKLNELSGVGMPGSDVAKQELIRSLTQQLQVLQAQLLLLQGR